MIARLLQPKCLQAGPGTRMQKKTMGSHSNFAFNGTQPKRMVFSRDKIIDSNHCQCLKILLQRGP